MASSKTDIVNQALSRLGEPRISDFDENTPNAVVARLHYDTVRKSLLRSHAWSFATKRVELSQLSDAPVFGESYQYQLPADFIRLNTLNGIESKETEALYTIEGDKLLADASTAKVTYIYDVTDVSLYDSIFNEVLILKLGAEIALDVTNSSSKRNELLGMADIAMREGAFVDAQEIEPRVLSPLSSSPSLASRGAWGLHGSSANAYGPSIDSLVAQAGADGANGWTATPALVTDGERVVIQITWSGGTGDAPEAGFISPTGIVSTAAAATDVRGATGAAGAGTNWQGAYNAGTAYVEFDEVGYDGSRWVANQGVTGVTPTEGATEWDLSVEKGDTGATGSTGGTGATGAAGSNGSDGANAYVYVAYASDASGTDFTNTFDSGLDYIAIKSTTSVIASPVAGDFAGLWKNYKGATGATGATGSTGATGGTGSTGADGADGADGVNGGVSWNYSSTTTLADPTAGNFRLNNASPASATAIYIDDLDSVNASDMSAFLATWDDSTSTTKGTLVIQEVGSSGIAIYTITGVVDNTGWFTVNASYVAGTGSFTDTNLCSFSFFRTGDQGSAGAGSGDVSGPGAAVVDDNFATWNGTGGTDIQDSGLRASDFLGVTAGVTTFNTSPTVGAHTEGKLFYDETNNTFAFHNDEADITHQIGQENWIRAYNDSGSTISNGKAVYVTGQESAEDRLTIAPALADSGDTSRVIGAATHDIENGSFGYVTQFGDVNDLDLSAFTGGDPLWLSTSSAGDYQNTEPMSPNRSVFIGYVASNDASTGRLFLTTIGNTGSVQAGAATEILLSVRKGSAGTINRGEPIHISGYNVGQDVVEVEISDADDPSTIPAIGLANEAVTNSSNSTAIVSGRLNGIDTSSFTVGDELFVSTTAGVLTATKPVGSAAIQKVAIVARSNASSGVLEVIGAGRANDVPNFSAADKYWYSGTGGVTTEGDISSYGRSIIDDADASAARTTLGLGSAATSDSSDFATAAQANATHTGDVTGSTVLSIASEAVGTNELATGAVTTAKLGTDSVTNAKMADDSVDTAEIVDSAVTDAKIAVGVILRQTATKSAAYTAVAGDHVLVDSNAAAGDFEVTMPASPTAGDQVRVTMINDHATRIVTIDGDSTDAIEADTNNSPSKYSLCLEGDSVLLEWVGGGTGWSVTDDSIIPHACSAYGSTVTTNTAGVGKRFPLDSDNYDFGGIRSSTNTRIEIRRAGIYAVSQQGRTNTGLTAGQYIGVYTYVNGVAVGFGFTITTSSSVNATYTNVANAINLAAGDYVDYYFQPQQANKGLVGDSTISYLNISELR